MLRLTFIIRLHMIITAAVDMKINEGRIVTQSVIQIFGTILTGYMHSWNKVQFLASSSEAHDQVVPLTPGDNRTLASDDIRTLGPADTRHLRPKLSLPPGEAVNASGHQGSVVTSHNQVSLRSSSWLSISSPLREQSISSVGSNIWYNNYFHRSEKYFLTPNIDG